MSQINVDVNEGSGNIIVVENKSVAVVTAVTEGPQGPPGPPGPAVGTLSALLDVDVTGVEDKSILVFNASESKFKANGTWTTDTVTDGGNF